jgi:hypothetical protein
VTPAGGALIVIGTVVIVSEPNGNFSTIVGASGVPTFPAATRVTACPSNQLMHALVSSGDCNSCHVIGGATQPIHL